MQLLGCGSSTIDLPRGSSKSGSTVQLESLSGKFFLGDSIAGAPVEVRDLNEVVLLTSETDDSGNFVFLSPSLPSQVRVVARLGELEFSSVKTFTAGEPDAFVVVSLATTIVSRYCQAHPEISFDGANDWLSSVVEDADGIDWSYFLDESSRFDFSHLGFFAVAARNGGVEATVSALLQGAELREQTSESGTDAIFQLDSDDFEVPFDTLEGDLRPVAETLRTLLADEGKKVSIISRIGGLIKGCLADAALGGIGDSIWGWLMTALGLDDRTLSNIQNQLDEMQRLLVELSGQVDRSQFEQAAAHINSEAIVPITVLSEKMSAIVKVNNPSASTVDDLRKELTEYQASVALLTMQNYLLGTNNQTNILALALRQKMTALGVQQQPNFMNFPVRTNRLINELLTVFHLYEGYQVLAINLLAETAHLQDNPANHIPLADQRISQALYSLKKQRQQLPQPLPSDQVLADLQFGLMWYLEVQSPRTQKEAARFAEGFTLFGSDGIVYDDWRLPYLWELEALQARGRFSGGKDSQVKTWGSGSYGYVGNSAAGLPALGFRNVSILNERGALWSRDYTTNVSGSSQYDLVGNINGTGLQVEYYRRNFRGEVPFLLVRSVGRPLQNPRFQQSPPYPPEKRIRPAEAPALGVPSSFKELIVKSGFSFPLYTVKPTVNYTIHTGGSFRCGVGSTSQDFSLIRRAPAVEVSKGSDHIVSYRNPDTSVFEIGNATDDEGRIIWHTANAELTPVELSASILGAKNGVFPLDIEFSESKELQSERRVLQAIRVFPRNRAYPDARNLPSDLRYSAVGFYSDRTVEDLTDEVEWEVTDRAGQPVPGADFSSNFSGALLLHDPESGDLLIEAQLKDNPSLSDQTDLTVGVL